MSLGSPGQDYEEDFEDDDEHEPKEQEALDEYDEDFDDEGEHESTTPVKSSSGSSSSNSSSDSNGIKASDNSSSSSSSSNLLAEAIIHGNKEKKAISEEKPQWTEVNFDKEVTLGDCIGGGGFALVYSGRWKGKKVALKTLFDPRVDKLLKQEYFAELNTLARLKHPRIVQLLGAATKPPNLCFIMELCANGSLYSYVHEKNSPGSIKESFLINVSKQVAEAFVYLHSLGIIHRDLKTHNILLDDNFDVKLCDFGLAQSDVSSQGTPSYMAPELIRNMKFDNKVDVFAFGVMLWEIFCKKKPWNGLSPAEVCRAVAGGERLPIPKWGCPDVVVGLMETCWKKNPKDRPTFKQVIAELEKYKPNKEDEITDSLDAMDSLMGGDALSLLMKK
eukprot:g1061.t1